MLQVDGWEATVDDGTPFSISVTIKSDAEDRGVQNKHVTFTPTDVVHADRRRILRWGSKRRKCIDIFVSLPRQRQVFELRSISLVGKATLFNTKLFFTGAKVSSSTYDLDSGNGPDLPRVFDPVLPVNDGLGKTKDLLIMNAPAFVTATSMVPEPSSAIALLGLGIATVLRRHRRA